MTTTRKTTARRRRAPSTTREERFAKVTALADRLAAFAESVDDDQREEYEARFDHYSPRNALLIVMQDPDATVVRGFHAWHDAGRKVRKGEHGIQILAPAGTSEVVTGGKPATNADAPQGDATATKSIRQHFRLAYVFDIRQTEPITDEPAGSEQS